MSGVWEGFDSSVSPLVAPERVNGLPSPLVPSPSVWLRGLSSGAQNRALCAPCSHQGSRSQREAGGGGHICESEVIFSTSRQFIRLEVSCLLLFLKYPRVCEKALWHTSHGRAQMQPRSGQHWRSPLSDVCYRGLRTAVPNLKKVQNTSKGQPYEPFHMRDRRAPTRRVGIFNHEKNRNTRGGRAVKAEPLAPREREWGCQQGGGSELPRERQEETLSTSRGVGALGCILITVGHQEDHDLYFYPSAH